MTVKWRSRIIIIAFLSAFFIVGTIANVTWNEPLSITSTMVFSSLSIIWTLSVGFRIIHRRQRRYFVFLGVFMLFWMIERAVKFSNLLTSEVLDRYLWYAYYIPIILMPLISLIIAFCLGKSDSEKLNPKIRLIYIPAAILIILVLTNDFHQLAFGFNENFNDWRFTYSYGVVYYLVLIWIVACIAATLIITVRFSARGGGKKRGFIPLLVILVSFVGVAIYIYTDFRQLRAMNVPELVCFCVAAFWEACLQTGLIPSNTGYDLLFKKTHLCAKIADTNGKIIYEAAQAEEGATYISHEQKISGGKITWLEDITVITEQKEQLKKANKSLAEKARITEQENKLKEEKTRIEEQNRIYGVINASLKPQTDKIRFLVNEAEADKSKWQKNMLEVCVIGAYIKRKSNLMLFAARNSIMPLSELELSLKESLSYLSKEGVISDISDIPNIDFPSNSVLYAYDEFEKAVEEKIPELSRVSINIKEKQTSVLFDIKLDSTPLLFELEKEGCE